MAIGEVFASKVQIKDIKIEGQHCTIKIEEIEEGFFHHPAITLKVQRGHCHQNLENEISGLKNKIVYLKLLGVG